ncbi:hypothetical protein BC826DRAFT_1035314, partial [Russula brevipes]
MYRAWQFKTPSTENQGILCVSWQLFGYHGLSSQELEWGFHCTGCRESHISRPLHFRRKFTI